MAMDWFRWHHGSVTDPKFQLVAKRAGASTAEVLAVWACLLEEASQAEERGHLGAIDYEALDCALGMEDGRSKAIHERMQERGLFTEAGAVEAWDRRQPKREREDDNSTERSRACRAKQRQATPSNANATQETPRLDEIRVDKKEEGDSADAPAPAKKKKPEALECPEDVEPQVWADWLALRKRKSAPVTATVISGSRDEAKKAQMSFNDFLKVWCRRGSQGLEAEWLKKGERFPAPTQARDDAEETKRMLAKQEAGRAPIPESLRAQIDSITKHVRAA